jgi:hypothetical protein
MNGTFGMYALIRGPIRPDDTNSPTIVAWDRGKSLTTNRPNQSSYPEDNVLIFLDIVAFGSPTENVTKIQSLCENNASKRVVGVPQRKTTTKTIVIGMNSKTKKEKTETLFRVLTFCQPKSLPKNVTTPKILSSCPDGFASCYGLSEFSSGMHTLSFWNGTFWWFIKNMLFFGPSSCVSPRSGPLPKQ